jgi:hypothetical protein
MTLRAADSTKPESSRPAARAVHFAALFHFLRQLLRRTQDLFQAARFASEALLAEIVRRAAGRDTVRAARGPPDRKRDRVW